MQSMKRFYYLVTFLFCISVVPYAGCDLGLFEPGDFSGRKIAFLSRQNSIRRNIFLMNEDGSGQTQITNVIAFAYGISFFSWSPDGSRIVYSGDTGPLDGPEIYMINADGTGIKRIGSSIIFGENDIVYGVINTYPSWSPDGSRIAFVKQGIRTSNIYIINADGSNETRITENSTDKRNPSWSPDGKKIAYSSKNDRGYDIYTIRTDGSNKIRLTYLEAYYQKPYWSPDGSKILFRSLKDNLSEIYVMDSDGTNLTKLTDNNGFNWSPVWSPDGSRIVFSSNLSGDFEIYTINADGSKFRNVSHNPRNDGSPSWSPDGSQIVFSSTLGDVSLIYAINSDGTHVRVLAQGWSPVWQPVLR